MSDTWIAVILGIVEGLTEFIPVSSTGHLILAEALLKFSGPRAEVFAVFIQLGAILAIVVLYPKFFLDLFKFSQRQDAQEGFCGMQGLAKLAAGALPAFVIGFLTHHFIKTYLFSPFTVALGLLFGAVFILLVENRKENITRKSVRELTVKDCLLVGVFQCLSLWPGFSRSGATIMGGMLLGFDRKLAAEFSFLLAVPVMLVASLYDLYHSRNILVFQDIYFFGLGFIVPFVVALIVVRLFLGFVAKYKFTAFAYYRIFLAALVICLMEI